MRGGYGIGTIGRVQSEDVFACERKTDEIVKGGPAL